MKKILLSTFTITLCFVSAFSQIQFKIESPASIAGNVGFTTTADPGVSPAGWTATPDLNDTANAVMDTLMFVEDGTTGLNPQGNPISQEGCFPLINDLTGKIAVVWRNTCQFGLKILYAEQAGARAVIIINREAGLVNMAPGDSGAICTIPAVFVENADGVVIANEMANGPVVAFMGTRYFANNLTINPADVIRPKAASTPAAYAQDNSEYDVQVGSWVVNGGTDSTSAILNAKITFGGTTLYDVPSAPTPLLPGDSAYFALPTFSQASYSPGMYNITYSVDTTGDEFISDNEISQDFHISNTKFSNVTLDTNEEMVLGPYYRPGNALGSVSMCVPFMDPNASRMAAMGVSFAAVCSGCDLSNRYFTTYAHEWGDIFTDLNDPNAAITNINTIGTGEFTFPNDSAYQEVYVPFTDPVNLLDNQRYLFCVNTYDTDIYIGFNDDLDYNQNMNNVYMQPVSCVEDNGTWYLTGFGSDVTAGVSVELTTNLNVQEDELFSIDAYPNPANNVVTIPLKGYSGKGSLNIMDVTGKIISTSTVNVNNLMTVDVTKISNGNYIFDLNLEDGRSTKFNIVISK
ncbi:MAG: T9SS C-terminal target domain-containing protein [Crocinitomicaceae bacterium TMED135]|nr:MAG: T9SS C-terminal target domain-containing protein [Crocinitomicaceae bacterium TMED135]